MNNMQTLQPEEVGKKPRKKTILYLIIGIIVGVVIMLIIYFSLLSKDSVDYSRAILIEELENRLEQELSIIIDEDIDMNVYEKMEGPKTIDILASVSLDGNMGQVLSPDGAEETIFMRVTYEKSDGQWQLGDDFIIYLGMDLMGIQQVMNEGMEKADDARIKSNINQLRTQAELIWMDNSSYFSLCASDSLNETASGTYGEKLRSLEDDMVERQGGVLDMHCQADDDSYCVSAKLSTGEYFCADSDGRVVDDATNMVCSLESINCE